MTPNTETTIYGGGKKSTPEIAEQLHYFLGTSAVYQYTAFFPDPPTK